MLALKAGDYTDTLAAVQAAKAAQKAGEYALDTVSVMVQDGNQALVPRYAAIYKQNNAKSPLAGCTAKTPMSTASSPPRQPLPPRTASPSRATPLPGKRP